MLRGQSWIFICSFVILAIAITGICLAVTPVAAAALQNNSTTNAGTLDTTLHTQGSNSASPPAAQTTSQPSADTCLLCYSPSHTLLSRLSEWMGK
jgi:hypothetical protein